MTSTLYECSECGERQTTRRCPDCNTFTRRLGPGGPCPHCEENTLVTELLEESIHPKNSLTQTT